MLTAAAIVGVGLLLTGCVPSEPIVTPVETGVGEPIFASDEEALAAAVEAYVKYLETSDEIGRKGWQSTESLEPLVTDELFAEELAASERLRASGRHQQGSGEVTNHVLQQYWDLPPRTANVVVYVCVDISSSRIYDSLGLDVTPTDRSDQIALEARLVSHPSEPTRLLISGVLPWTGSGVCS
ncbi:MAG: hypothetical protein KF680_02600 [Cryobacterium sp.]|nr:hypothetical protein [Cryobacterium sp.]